MDFIAQALSLGKYSKPQSILSIYTQIEGYLYMVTTVLLYCFPVLDRSYFGLVTDNHMLSDTAIRIMMICVFNIGFFYLVAGRANSKEFILGSALNRIPLVSGAVLYLYYHGDLDLGAMLVPVSFDTFLCVILLCLIGTYGIEEGFKPLDKKKKK